MICPVPEGCVDVCSQIPEGLAGKGKNEIHRNGFKRHPSQRFPQSLCICVRPPQNLLEFWLEGLYSDADFGYARSLQVRSTGGVTSAGCSSTPMPWLTVKCS